MSNSITPAEAEKLRRRKLEEMEEAKRREGVVFGEGAEPGATPESEASSLRKSWRGGVRRLEPTIKQRSGSWQKYGEGGLRETPFKK